MTLLILRDKSSNQFTWHNFLLHPVSNHSSKSIKQEKWYGISSADEGRNLCTKHMDRNYVIAKRSGTSLASVELAWSFSIPYSETFNDFKTEDNNFICDSFKAIFKYTHNQGCSALYTPYIFWWKKINTIYPM